MSDIITIDDNLCGSLDNYIQFERKRASMSLFTSRSSNCISRRMIQNTIEKYSGNLRINFNTIRNSVALHDFRKDGDFIKLNKRLRHESYGATGCFLDRFFRDDYSSKTEYIFILYKNKINKEI